MSARQTVLHTKKGYGRIIFAPPPQKKKSTPYIKETNDVTTGDFLKEISIIDISDGFKQVSLPRRFRTNSL
jgi:hypothetical protein